jgi:kinetochore protein Nuf2
LREGSKEKAMSAKERMEELRAVHRKLTEERGEKGRDMERRRVRIEQTEKKVCWSSISRHTSLTSFRWRT